MNVLRMPRAGRGDMFSRNSREDILRDVLGLAPAEDATEELQQTEQLEAGASGEENSQNTFEQTNVLP